MEKGKYIALIGNPNCGKSTLFNRLTGLRQKTSNLPGTTIEQKSGTWKSGLNEYRITDLPGIYSLYTDSDEEKIVVDHLLGIRGKQQPDHLIFLLDASNLRRNLLLFDQVAELNLPTTVVLSMTDTAERRGIKIDTQKLQVILSCPVLSVNPRTGEGISELESLAGGITEGSRQSTSDTEVIKKLLAFRNGEALRGLAAETLGRYKKLEEITKQVVQRKPTLRSSITARLDNWATHPVAGFLIFALVMLTIFQGVFTLAEYPMSWIESGFNHLGASLTQSLPDNFLSRLLTGGILTGLSGVIVFLPQIAILFFFISILEDSGYMVRASFITDRLMQKIGLNGRSVIPLIGGFACAIPSIMATRSIKNRSERLATMFIIPLMSCSARLPVYVLLVSLAVPSGAGWGPFGLQGVIMTAAYFAGIVLAVIISWLIKVFRKGQQNSEFILEMPAYQIPRLQNVWSNVLYKSGSFVREAGKIIIIISVILWFLAAYGPEKSMTEAENRVHILAIEKNLTGEETARLLSAEKLKASYAGIMGRFIEPAIAPLGYDWKTGIALISSFAAREVFVGTMSTLFNSSDADNIEGIRKKMAKARDPLTNKPLYTVPYALSLIIFYAFALQCVSTMAVMRREAGGWKLPITQFILFGALAYLAALAVYQISVAMGL